MSKQPTGLRSFLSRTGELVTSRGLSKLRPRPPETTEHFGRERPDVETLGLAARISELRPRWLSALTERSTTTASLDGSMLRLLTLVNSRVVGWTSVPIPDRAARSGTISDPVALGTAIDDAFDQFALPRKHVSWALPGYGSTSRILDLPRLRGDELRVAINEEFERILGASTDDYFISSERLVGRVRQRQVYVLAVPRATVLSAIEALEVAGIHPHTMDLRPLAMVRAVGKSEAIIANLEEGSLDVVIVEHGVPALMRSLPLVGAAAAREAAQNRLVEETERSLMFFDDTHPDHPLDLDAPLYLTGSLATGVALADRLRAVTRHPIGRLQPAGSYPSELPTADYIVNLGLALKQA